MTIDTLEVWEKWPVAALVAAAGLNTAIWYAGDVLPIEARGLLPWLITIAAIASVVAIDGSLIATIAGRRQGRRNRWGVANICVTALFTALAALSAHSAIVGIAPWLHGLFAATIVTYAMHLEQPRADTVNPLVIQLKNELAAITREAIATSERLLHTETMLRMEQQMMAIMRESIAPTVATIQTSAEQSNAAVEEIRSTVLQRTFRANSVRDGFVYVLRTDQGTHKIGMARDVASRVKSIASFVPFQLETILTIATDDMRQLEKGLHSCFADRRLRGEWFALSDEDIDALHSIGDELQSDAIDETLDTLSMVVNLPVSIDAVLTDTMPDIVRLKDVAKLSFAQIGDQLGISRQAAWQQYKAAKKH